VGYHFEHIAAVRYFPPMELTEKFDMPGMSRKSFSLSALSRGIFSPMRRAQIR
jgi:hypothetical protein